MGTVLNTQMQGLGGPYAAADSADLVTSRFLPQQVHYDRALCSFILTGTNPVAKIAPVYYDLESGRQYVDLQQEKTFTGALTHMGEFEARSGFKTGFRVTSLTGTTPSITWMEGCYGRTSLL